MTVFGSPRVAYPSSKYSVPFTLLNEAIYEYKHKSVHSEFILYEYVVIIVIFPIKLKTPLFLFLFQFL